MLDFFSLIDTWDDEITDFNSLDFLSSLIAIFDGQFYIESGKSAKSQLMKAINERELLLTSSNGLMTIKPIEDNPNGIEVLIGDDTDSERYIFVVDRKNFRVDGACVRSMSDMFLLRVTDEVLDIDYYNPSSTAFIIEPELGTIESFHKEFLNWCMHRDGNSSSYSQMAMEPDDTIGTTLVGSITVAHKMMEFLDSMKDENPLKEDIKAPLVKK